MNTILQKNEEEIFISVLFQPLSKILFAMLNKENSSAYAEYILTTLAFLLNYTPYENIDLFQPIISNVVNLLQNDNLSFEQKISIFDVISAIANRYFSLGINDFPQGIGLLELTIKIITSSNSVLYEECLITIASIVYSIKDQALIYIEPIMHIIYELLGYKNSRVTEQTIFLISALFVTLKENMISYLPKTFKILLEIAQDIDTSSEVLLNIIHLFADILYTLPNHISNEIRDIIFQLIQRTIEIIYINTSKEIQTQFFDSIFYCFSSLFQSCDYELPYNKVIFVFNSLINKYKELKSFKDKTISSFCKLLNSIGSTYKRKSMRDLNSRAIHNILSCGIQSSNAYISNESKQTKNFLIHIK